MRLHILATATGLALALAGCVSSGGLHPDGTLTDAGSLHADRSFSKVGVSPAAWPATDWWTALGDSQLNGLIDEALRDNPNLAMVDARTREAQAQAGAADAARSPTVGVDGSVSGARIPQTIIPEPFGGHYANVTYGFASFKWDLDLWGGQRAAWEAAVGQAHAAEIDARAARIEISTNVARAYVQLGYAFTQQDVARAELDRSHQARVLTLQRVNAGVDNKIQLRQSDSEVADAEVQLAQAGRSVDSARIALALLLGQGPDRGLDIARPQALQPAALSLPPNMPAELLGRRADLVASRWRVEAAGKNITSAKTKFLPNIQLGAMAGLATLGGKNLFSSAARFYEIAPAISLPIFDGGRLRSNLAGVDAQYDQAIAQYNKTLVGALNEVADDLNGLQSLQTQIEAQQRAHDAASQAWDLAEQRYKAGVGSYLEALIVRQQLLLTEQRMAALNAQQVDLSVQLIQALGGGFRPEAGDTPLASAPTTNKS